MEFIAQGFGWAATILFLLSDLQDDDAKLDFYYTSGNVMFLFHLTLLHAWIPAATVLMAIARNVINRKFDNRGVKIFFLMSFTSTFAVTLHFASDWQLALPALVSVIMTVAFLYASKHWLTLASVTASLLWIVVGMHLNSWPIVALEIISIAFLSYRTVSIIKIDQNKN